MLPHGMFCSKMGLWEFSRGPAAWVSSVVTAVTQIRYLTAVTQIRSLAWEVPNVRQVWPPPKMELLSMI